MDFAPTSLLHSVFEWWERPYADPETVRAFQSDQLRRLVARAAQEVPYYQRLFREAGSRADGVSEVADLARIPISTKRALLEAPIEDQITPGTDLSRCLVRHSSGSTGEPSVIVRSHQEQRTLRLYALRAALQAGAEPWERRVFVRTDTSPRAWFQRWGLFPLFEVDSRREPGEILVDLRRLRADVLYSFPHLLVRLAQEYIAGGCRGLRIRRVVAGGDTFTAADKAIVREAFRCPVYDAYGLHQCELAAWECPYCGLYHMCEDGVIVEVLVGDRPARPGEEGRAVITPLHSFTAPLLRFETGDLVRLPEQPRPCRVRFQQIERILGRQRNFLPMPDGSLFPPLRLSTAIRLVDGLGWFQIQQPALDRVIVLYEPVRGDDSDISTRIMNALRPMLPPEVGLSTRRTDSFEFTPGGKLKVIRPFQPASAADAASNGMSEPVALEGEL